MARQITRLDVDNNTSVERSVPGIISVKVCAKCGHDLLIVAGMWNHPNPPTLIIICEKCDSKEEK